MFEQFELFNMKTIVNKNKAFKAKKLVTISASKEKTKIARPKSFVKTFYQ